MKLSPQDLQVSKQTTLVVQLEWGAHHRRCVPGGYCELPVCYLENSKGIKRSHLPLASWQTLRGKVVYVTKRFGEKQHQPQIRIYFRWRISFAPKLLQRVRSPRLCNIMGLQESDKLLAVDHESCPLLLISWSIQLATKVLKLPWRTQGNTLTQMQKS